MSLFWRYEVHQPVHRPVPVPVHRPVYREVVEDRHVPVRGWRAREWGFALTCVYGLFYFRR